MRRIIGNVITVILVIIIIFMSVLLLSHNEYQVSQFGKYTLLIVDEDMLDYKSGSLLIVTKKQASNIQAGDYVFYYDRSGAKVKPVLGFVNELYDVSFGKYSFKVNNDVIVDEEDIIAKIRAELKLRYPDDTITDGVLNYILKGYNHRAVGDIYGLSRQAINVRVQKIRKIYEKIKEREECK